MNHKECLAERHGGQAHKVDLRLLRSCRQLYMEAANVLYHDTTFCFRDITIFERFFLSLNPRNAAILRKLHISWAAMYEDYIGRDWRFMDMKSLPELPGLRVLHIEIEFMRTYPRDRDCNSTTNLNKSWFDSLMRFQVYNLGSVTVVASDQCVSEARGQAVAESGGMLTELPWTVQQERTLAERMRSQSLDPNGRNIAIQFDAQRRRHYSKQERRSTRNLYAEGILEPKRSQRIQEADRKLRMFHSALDHIVLWLAEARLDTHSAQIMLSGTSFRSNDLDYSSRYEELNEDDMHLWNNHLVAVVRGKIRTTPTGGVLAPQPPAPCITLSHNRESYDKCDRCPKLEIVQDLLNDIEIPIDIWPWRPSDI